MIANLLNDVIHITLSLHKMGENIVFNLIMKKSRQLQLHINIRNRKKKVKYNVFCLLTIRHIKIWVDLYVKDKDAISEIL